jgi:hypothetical protein
MATVKVPLLPGPVSLKSTAYAQFKSSAGTNFPVDAWAFDGATEEDLFVLLMLQNYGSGNLTLRLTWYADSTTSGDVIWGAAVAAITPDTDSQDVETKAFATANTVTDSHLGTTAQRVHQCTITISNLDSVAANDIVWLRIYRDADAAGDTLNAVDANLLTANLEYSDT